MAVAPLPAPRFIRKTQLGANEYRKNFHQIDCEIIAALTSTQADQVTPLMSKIYLCMVNAPAKYWERDGVLRIEAEMREGNLVKSWAVLCDLTGVASATASKAIRWMHEQGIIGYFSGKNGVGLRIFLNRASSSIGARQAQGSKKILDFSPASSVERRASQNEPAFNVTYGDLENSDTDINSCAPKNGTETKPVVKISPEPAPVTKLQGSDTAKVRGIEPAQPERPLLIGEIVRQVVAELGSSVNVAARQAAAREHERTREWLETRGLPKAARVAQREAYNVLRSHGLINPSAQSLRRDAEVGRSHTVAVEAKPLTADEIRMFAEVCVALLETQGQALDVSLAEMSSEVGGSVLQEDAPKIRQAAHAMISSSAKEG